MSSSTHDRWSKDLKDGLAKILSSLGWHNAKPASSHTPKADSLTTQLIALLFDQSPFSDFHAPDIQASLSTDSLDISFFNEIIDTLKPNLAIDINAGNGAVSAHIVQRASLYRHITVISIDNWTGEAEQWRHPVARKKLLLKHGRPRLYEQFLVNMKEQDCHKSIVPMPMPPMTAAKILASLGASVPLIHLGGFDNFDLFKHSLKTWWPFLTPGGLIIGDHYDTAYLKLIQAISEFCEETTDIISKGSRLSQWYLQKSPHLKH